MYIYLSDKDPLITPHNSNTYRYEIEFHSFDLDYSEELEFDFSGVRNVIQIDIKYLFNYDRAIDGIKILEIDDDYVRFDKWKIMFRHFLSTLWEDERNTVIRQCFNYAEECLFYHRQICNYCQPDGDCDATAIWKQRLADGSDIVNKLYDNSAQEIFKKYVGIPVSSIVNKSFDNIEVEIPQKQVALPGSKPEYNKIQRVATNTFIKSKVLKRVITELLPYFGDDVHSELKSVLREGTIPKEKLVFNGNGNLLGNFFGQLHDCGHVVGKKYDLKDFIISGFKYKHAGIVKDFKAKYVEKLLEGKLQDCKKPISTIKNW